jgi:hypothetical protein
LATWQEFEEAAPEMAALGLQQLKKFGLAYLGTLYPDGSPRVNPVCPVLCGGRLFVATPERSPKFQHLLADGRYVLHMLPGKQEEEFWVRGIARHSDDAELRQRVMKAAEGITRIQPDEVLFEYDIQAAGTTTWADFGTPNHRPQRKFWRAP